MSPRKPATVPTPPVPTGEGGLFTSKDLFGDVVDSPPSSVPVRSRVENQSPVKVRVADAVQAEAVASPASGASTELSPEVEALLDAFAGPARAAAASERAATKTRSAGPDATDGVDVDRLLDAFSGPAEGALRATPAGSSAKPAAKMPPVALPGPATSAGAGSRAGSDDTHLRASKDPRAEPPAPPVLESEHHGLDPDWDSLLGHTPEDEAQPVPRAAFDDVVDTLLGDLGSPRTPGEFDEDLDSALGGLTSEPAPSTSPTTRLRGSWRDDRYGPYQLLDRVAVGGMAEVFKARYEGVEGFEKIVAVKRILPHLSDNPEFVEMFVQEAKMVAGLSHANIVQIHDLGRIDKSFFIAMEFVHGRDLRSILRRVREKGMKLPLDLSLLIVREVCAALDYAHRKRDDRGRPMRIVHRDVSPQNILISFEGDVKLADFGIAKAATKASSTEGGALRGKLMYMSPEQAWGQPMDGRSDTFSLGLVLYEMVSDIRPFVATSEMSILEMVRACKIRPPREVNPRIPEALDRAIVRALARDVEDRYQDAGEMGRALDRVFPGRHLPASADLSHFLSVLYDVDEREEAIPEEAFPEDSSRREIRLEEHQDLPQPGATPPAEDGDDVLAELGLD